MFGFLLGALMCGTPALAEESWFGDALVQTAQDPIQIEVLVIHGTETHSNTDPKLKYLLKSLEDYKYTGYKVLETKNSKLVEKQEQSFVLPKDIKATIGLQSYTDTEAKLKINMVKSRTKNLMSSIIKIKKGGNFVIAGPKYDKGILLFAISVKN